MVTFSIYDPAVSEGRKYLLCPRSNIFVLATSSSNAADDEGTAVMMVAEQPWIANAREGAPQ